MSEQPAPNPILAKIQPIATKVWVSSRPTIAQGLRATIGTLQSAADRLDRQIQADPTPAKPLNLEPAKQAANTFWKKAQPIWVKLMRWIRSRLPAEVSGKLSNRALSGLIAGLGLLLLTVTTHLPSATATPKPQSMVVAQPRTTPVRPVVPRQDAIAQQFPVDAQGSQQPFPTALSAPGTQPAVAPPVSINKTPASTIAPTAIPPSTATNPPTTSIAPASKIAPTITERQGVGGSPVVAEPPLAPTISASQPLAAAVPPTKSIAPKATAIKPTPVKLTPDQKLLVKLQAATGDRPTLLQGVKPNKAQGTLQITLKPDWYDLAFAQQDTVAQDLFTKAQALRFKTLELVNGAGVVLARSPVVGNEMVVLLRKIES